jgi:cyclophilin family peptidyl-prolyl cis-trans isomerase
VRPGALARRLATAAEVFTAAGAGALVVASGGRAWAGVVEADAMRRELALLGVPEAALACERSSLSTRENARYSADVLKRRGTIEATVVTCDWHLARALRAFERAGISATGAPAPSGLAPWRRRLWRWGRERVLSWGLVLAATMMTLVGCARAPATVAATDAGVDAGPPAADAVERAEDARRAKDVPAALATSHDETARRRAARAFARILDGDDAPLLRALDDDDDQVIAWGAYGLGESCKGKEGAHVAALAARLASAEPARPVGSPIDARLAILRALGRCAGDVAEQTLRAWLRRTNAAPETLEAACYALGDVAARRGSLSLESGAALLDAAQRDPPVVAALYPLGRNDVPDDLQPRVLAAARAALARPSPARFFAVRALGRAGTDGADDLSRVLATSTFTPPERAEAARGLGRLHKAGQNGLADGIDALLSASSAPTGIGDAFGVLRTAVDALGVDVGKHAESALWSVARLDAGSNVTAPAARRASQLRCAAASELARAAFDSDVLKGCDVADGEAGEQARLAALDRGDLTHARRAAWLALTHSTHRRVREAAIEAIERHPELGDAALPVLAEALASDEAGVVATAADVVHGHPDRVFVLAESEKRAALDPHAPPPTANPAKELDRGIAKALRAALTRPWSEDLVETRLALMDAALAVSLDEAKAFAQTACRDPNVTVRSRAAKALAAAGDKSATCPAPDGSSPVAPEIDALLPAATTVSFDTDAGPLSITFDPALTPVAATRFVALARSGFYTGVVIHRVVPGFVVQLGDRGGDGYGGSGQLLRCETSPPPYGTFGALDVGVALAGRDTGSSQIFVTLARHPHLDGQYARVGRASGDWDAVAEGDVVQAVHVR